MTGWRSVLAVAGFTAVLALGACGGRGGGDDAAPGAVGPIPAEEFAAMPVPTFNLVITAFRTVTSANPALLANEPALSRALFDEVKRLQANLPEAAVGRAIVLDGLARVTRQALFNLDSRLTLEEWKLVIRSPLNSARAASTIEVSAQAAVDSLPCDTDIGFTDGKADALRHAYWNALMTRRTSAAFAELFATAHETGSSNSTAATAMDQHNNAAGRALALRYPEATDAELLELLLQQAYAFVAAGSAITPAWTGLVHIAEDGRRPFDGTFTGTLSETAAGGAPYTLRVDLAQCGATLHGRWAATRDGATTVRRFSGTLTGPGTMTLVVPDPLPFETEVGPSPCASMGVELSGSEQALNGSWSSWGPSAVCLQGGRFTVARP